MSICKAYATGYADESCMLRVKGTLLLREGGSFFSRYDICRLHTFLN
jgi:hypothetical protein